MQLPPILDSMTAWISPIIPAVFWRLFRLNTAGIKITRQWHPIRDVPVWLCKKASSWESAMHGSEIVLCPLFQILGERGQKRSHFRIREDFCQYLGI